MIICAGEALIDMLPRTDDAGDPVLKPCAGGAVFNTAIALGRLGAPTGFISGLSTDLFGAQLTESLTASGVDTGLCIRSDRPTTLAFVRLTDGHAQYTFYDENTAGRMLAEADLPVIPDSVSAVFFGGICLAVEPSGTAYEALMHRVAPGRAVMLDPNIRKDFITDEPAYRARIARMIAAADIVKLSDEDLGWLEGPGDSDDLARGLLARGPGLILLTKGGEGACAFGRNGAAQVAASRVKVVDTVGAGDTFNAGILAGLSRANLLTKDRVRALSPAQMEDALTLAARAAAITVSRAGANPPWQREV